MDELNNWKDMYQKSSSDTPNIDKLIERLNTIERSTRRRRFLLIICTLVLAITALLRLSEFENKYYIFSYILIGIAIAMKLFVLYKGKYNLINNETEFNNQNFIKDHISKLKEKVIFEKKHLIVFLVLMIAGLNCALIGLYDKGTIFNFEFNAGNRIYIHLATIALFFVGFYINSKKIDRYKNNISELITDLENTTDK